MRVRELEERERKESKKLADEDALRKIRVAEETIEHLQKKLAATKQVCVSECVMLLRTRCTLTFTFTHYTDSPVLLVQDVSSREKWFSSHYRLET